MIKIYDDNRNLLISTDEYSNFSVNKEINQPDQFSIDTTEEIVDFIKLEGYIETKEGIFVIKEKGFANYYRIMGSQDLEDLDDFIEHKRFERATLKGMIQGLVAPYGWTVVGDSPNKKTINIDNKAVIDGVFDCIDLFKYEIKFDNINKVIYIAKELGNDRGTYFHSDLNLKKTTISSDSYDFATRIIPIGHNGLTIESVNNGKKYLENYKYSNKIKTVYWKDERYHIPENLKATAEEMLENLAKPLYSLDCEIVNLVNNSKYSFLDFDVGDKVIIVDNNLKIKEKHRITSHLKYPNEPHRGVVTFENKPRDIIDRFTDIDYRFDNYDSRFDDYDFKFNDFDMRFDDFNMRLDDFNFELDQLKLDMGEFSSRYNDLSNRLSVIEEMLGIGLSCIVIKKEDIVKNKDLEDPHYWLPEEMNIFEYKDEYRECIIIPEDIEEVNIMGYKDDTKSLKVKNDGPINGRYMFANSYNLDISELNTEFMTSAESMFYLYRSGGANIIGIENMNTSNVTNMDNMFNNVIVKHLDISSFDTSNVVTMEEMFYYAISLEELNLTGLNTSSVESMSLMFCGTSNLKSLDLSSFDTSNVTTMSAMFYDCRSLSNLNLSTFDTSNVTDMAWMFNSCSSLNNLNLSTFDTSNVTDMERMFYDCSSLSNLNLSTFNTSNVTNMIGMFIGCSSLSNLNLSTFDTSNVTDMAWMFSYCSSLEELDISNFDFSSLDNSGIISGYPGMFYGCTSLHTLSMPAISGENVNIYEMFKDTPNLTGAIDLSGAISIGSVQEAFVNCGADVIYINENLSQSDIDRLENPDDNPNGIPVVVK